MNSNNGEQPFTDTGKNALKDQILQMQEWWRYLLSKWKIILITGIVGAGLGLTYAFLKAPTYLAELTFAVQDDQSGGGLSSAMGLANQFGIDLGSPQTGGAFSGDNILELMKARSMVESALLSPVVINGKRETLAELYIDFNGFRNDWKDDPKLVNIHFLPGADRSKFTLQQDSLLGEFHADLVERNIKVDKIDKDLSIIALDVKTKNELFSKYFTEMLEKGVSDFYIQTKTKKESKDVGVLQRQADSVRRELTFAIKGVAASVDATPNANPYRSVLTVPSQRKQVDVQANVLILGELVKNLELSKMTLLQQTPLIQVIDSPILPLEKKKTGKLIGLIVGGMIGGFLILIVLFAKKSYTNIISSDNQQI